MKLSEVRIINFRCFDNVTLACGNLHAIVGTNSAGKSTIIHALDFLFNPSAARITADWFHHRITVSGIRVEALFTCLSDQEKDAFKGYLRPDGTFQFARIARWIGSAVDGSAEVTQAYNKPQPRLDWLNQEKIDAEEIKKWATMSLAVNGYSFTDFLKGQKLTVSSWKGKAREFAALYLNAADYVDGWAENPKGFAGVLKGNLPDFELVPAVRNVAEEEKVSKTNPLGRLIRSILEKLDPTLRQEMESTLSASATRLNRSAGSGRLQAVVDVEKQLCDYMREIFLADVELLFEPPSVETILSTPTMIIDDGFPGPVQFKGHGLQRAMIMSILRAYSNLVTSKTAGQRRTLILGIEEPELYMHPPMLRSVRRMLRKLADGGDQVLFSTHNPIMVDVRYFDEIVRVERAADGKAAAVHQLPIAALIEDIEARFPNIEVTEESMRERYSHVYTSSRNEGFFAQIVILVEGPTELYSLPIYAEALGHDFDSLGIVVVECGTKDQIDRLYRVFNELGIPCYVLFDYDLGGEAETNSKDLLTWLGIKLEHSPVAAVIRDTVACFKKDWEADLMVEIPGYENLVANAKKDLGLRNDSKPLKARYVAQTLVSRTPPFVPQVIKSVVEKAVKVKHNGTCLRKKMGTAAAL